MPIHVCYSILKVESKQAMEPFKLLANDYKTTNYVDHDSWSLIFSFMNIMI